MILTPAFSKPSPERLARLAEQHTRGGIALSHQLSISDPEVLDTEAMEEDRRVLSVTIGAARAVQNVEPVPVPGKWERWGETYMNPNQGRAP